MTHEHPHVQDTFHCMHFVYCVWFVPRSRRGSSCSVRLSPPSCVQQKEAWTPLATVGVGKPTTKAKQNSPSSRSFTISSTGHIQPRACSEIQADRSRIADYSSDSLRFLLLLVSVGIEGPTSASTLMTSESSSDRGR